MLTFRIPPEYGGKRDKVIGRIKRDNETKKKMVRLQGTDVRMILVELCVDFG
jgi:hypothetical protein